MVRSSLLSGVLVCLLAAGATLAAPAEKLTVEKTAELEFASDPRISPDGTSVVYVRRFSNLASDQRRSNLWIVGTDGKRHRALTAGDHSDSSPRWSPDGGRVAYLSDADGSPQIYVRWLDTGQTAKLTHLPSAPSGIVWSPDGKRIAFSAFVPSEGPRIGRPPTAPAGAKWADPPVVIDRLVYRFNGAGVLKPGYWHLFVVSAEGGAPRQLTSGDFNHGGPGLNGGGEAVWTPDGKSLLISAQRRPDWELEPLDTEIYRVPVDGGSIETLTHRKGPDNTPAVSPDGKKVAYVGFDDRYQGYQLSHLYILDMESGQSQAVAENFGRDVSQPQWASDGKGIFALYGDQGATKLAFFGLDGKVRTLAENLGGGGSAYAGGSFSLSRNDRFAFTLGGPHTPGDVGVGGLDSPAGPIVSLNQEWLAGTRLGEVEELWYESSFDHRKIQGWIIKPPGFDPFRKYPLILEIHGGPFAAYGPDFDIEKQVWAAAGYVVLYTNPRGSTGYGEEFGNLIHHAYPGHDFEDLNSGVDAVVSKGYIDTDNLFVTGGSGGGVLTAWVIGHTTRFRAAASIYPVINWTSWVLTADIASFGVKYWFPGFPWDYPEHYEKRSLLSVVKNVKTPTLVMTGEEDYRTPMSESEQYYEALKLLGVEAVLVRVPGEPHGIRRRPSHHMEKIAIIQGWFDQHRSASGARSH